jgi:hypothetical protein
VESATTEKAIPNPEFREKVDAMPRAEASVSHVSSQAGAIEAENEAGTWMDNRLPRELLDELGESDDDEDDDDDEMGSEASSEILRAQDEADASQLIEGATQVLSLLRVIGKAYAHMCRYVL